MKPTSAEIQLTVKEQFAAVAAAPGQEKKLPIGPGSAKKLGYDPNEIDACRRPLPTKGQSVKSSP